MHPTSRRGFLKHSALAAMGAVLPKALWARVLSRIPGVDRRFSASDTVTLGNTGITTSRLAMGTGTFGFGHQSRQSGLGVNGLSGLLQHGYDNGLRLFDTADAYGTHAHVADALKHVDRS